MTPKEKANELVDKFDNFDVLGEDHNGFTAQQCALVAVDEMVHYLEIVLGVDKSDFEYWQEVKQEIEKL
jgi:hypothetical protein